MTWPLQVEKQYRYLAVEGRVRSESDPEVWYRVLAVGTHNVGLDKCECLDYNTRNKALSGQLCKHLRVFRAEVQDDVSMLLFESKHAIEVVDVGELSRAYAAGYTAGRDSEAARH